MNIEAKNPNFMNFEETVRLILRGLINADEKNQENINIIPFINNLDFEENEEINFNPLKIKKERPRVLAPFVAPPIVVTPLIADTHGDEVERLPETTSYLEYAFARAGFTPNPFGQLERVMDKVPQVNASGYLLYLVTSGLSVEIITGYKRAHKDLDLVLMHPDVAKQAGTFARTDNVTADGYWAGMKLDNEFLTKTSFRAHSARIGGDVLCAHPGITLVQKVSDAWGREPREHDIHDANALGYWLLGQPKQRQDRDVSIAKVALDALSPATSAKTADRLNTMFENHPKLARNLLKAHINELDTNDDKPSLKTLLRTIILKLNGPKLT